MLHLFRINVSCPFCFHFPKEKGKRDWPAEITRQTSSDLDKMVDIFKSELLRNVHNVGTRCGRCFGMKELSTSFKKANSGGNGLC